MAEGIIPQAILQLGQGKDGGGDGPPRTDGPPAMGQAAPPDRSRGQRDPGDTEQPYDDMDQGPNFGPGGPGYQPGDLDAISRFQLHQRNMADIGQMARRGMPPNTSIPLRLHGNRLRAEAESMQRYLDQLKLEAELGRLGIGVPGQPSAYERAKREAEEEKQKSGNRTTYSDPQAPEAPSARPPAKF